MDGPLPLADQTLGFLFTEALSASYLFEFNKALVSNIHPCHRVFECNQVAILFFTDVVVIINGSCWKKVEYTKFDNHVPRLSCDSSRLIVCAKMAMIGRHMGLLFPIVVFLEHTKQSQTLFGCFVEVEHNKKFRLNTPAYVQRFWNSLKLSMTVCLKTPPDDHASVFAVAFIVVGKMLRYSGVNAKEATLFMREFLEDDRFVLSREVVNMILTYEKCTAPLPFFDSLSCWKKAIQATRAEVKQDRYDRMQTACNKVESRKKEIVRKNCALAKQAKEAKKLLHTTTAGPSGPRKKINWIAKDAEGESDACKRKAKKLASIEELRRRSEMKKKEAERQMEIQVERMRFLKIGFSIVEDDN